MIDVEKLTRWVVGFLLVVLLCWCSLLTTWQMQDEQTQDRLWNCIAPRAQEDD